MTTVLVIRDGEIKLRVPAEVRNGILRNGNSILINGDKIKAPYTKASVAAAIKARKITPEIEAMGMCIGDNGNGIVCMWLDDYNTAREAERKKAYDALPADVKTAREERAAISDLYYRSERALSHDTDGNNVSRGYRLQAEANSRLDAWRRNYPHAAAKERAQSLKTKADREDSLATGALTYDADGWYGPDEQQRRHDQHAQNGADLREEAENIIASLPKEWR